MVSASTSTTSSAQADGWPNGLDHEFLERTAGSERFDLEAVQWRGVTGSPEPVKRCSRGRKPNDCGAH